MREPNIFARLSQMTAAVAAALCAAVITSVGYYSQALPDEITAESGTQIRLETALPVTVQELAQSRAAYFDITDGGQSEPHTCRLSLRLFGSVPIKEVDEKIVDRPLLAAGGQAFGVKLVTDGVMIIDMKKIGGECPAKEAGLRIGDVIEAIDGERVSTNDRVSEIIKASGGESCTVRYRRGDKTYTCSVKPKLCEGSYRAGMWVRDSSAGIGTMTFIDPQTMTFAGLGHPICDNDTHEPLPLSNGSITPIRINGCTKSKKGEPGQLMGEFAGEDCGELVLNCEGGVYGSVNSMPEGYVTYPLGFAHEVHEGKAFIISQTGEGEPQEYEISIERITHSGEEDFGHDMIIKATDKELIKRTGGIVQGMSGSPIIQDGRLVGAVTHVFVDDPKGGYAIFAEKMYGYSNTAADISESAQAG